MKRTCLVAILAVALGRSSLLAHHSWAGFDVTPVTIDAEIEAVKIENPHTLIELRARDDQRYTLVWGAINALRRQGFTLEGPGSLKDLFRVGDRIVVTGRLKREESGIVLQPQQIEHKVHGLLLPRPRS